MAEKPLNQSSPRRAWEETKESFHKIRFFWSVEVVAVGVFTLLGIIITPENAGRLASAIYGTAGGAVGAFAGFGVIYLIHLIKAPYKQRNAARRLVLVDESQIIRVKEPYEDNTGECGLIFHNTGKNPLANCHARLLDLDFETPHHKLSLKTYPRSEDLVCQQNIADFGDGKIPLFRWERGTIDKKLMIVYQNKTKQIGYGVTNTPILVMLSIWADNVPASYCVCRLTDRLGWGYGLSILKTGMMREKLSLAKFQKSSLDRERNDTKHI